MSGDDEKVGTQEAPRDDERRDGWFVSTHDELVERELEQIRTGVHQPLGAAANQPKLQLKQLFIIFGIVALSAIGIAFFLVHQENERRLNEERERAEATRNRLAEEAAALAAADAECKAQHGEQPCRGRLDWVLISPLQAEPSSTSSSTGEAAEATSDNEEASGDSEPRDRGEGRRSRSFTPFWLSKGEVTVKQYAHCVTAGICSEPRQGLICNWRRSGYEEHPVNCITWAAADEFARWVGGALPSEAHWQAASTSPRGPYPWGAEEPSCDRVFFADESGLGCGEDRSAPPCSRQSGASSAGVCDLLGGMWEWLSDPVEANPESADGGMRESGDGAGSAPRERLRLRFVRGGSWRSSKAELMNRPMLAEGLWRPDVGFRVWRANVSANDEASREDHRD